MTYEQLEEGLYKGEQTHTAPMDGAPQQQQPVYGVPAQGYQQGYPVQQQQPLAGWPAYGAPGVYGTGMPAGAAFPGQPGYPYPPPPPPVGGGSEDEKYQISDVGVCTIAPGLNAPKNYWLEFALCLNFVFAGILFGFGAWIISYSGPIGLIPFTPGVLLLSLAIFFYRRVKKESRTTHHSSIQPEHVQAFIDRVTKIGATLPQINIIQSLLNQANPNTPHEFCVWKATAGVATQSPRSARVAARFGCQNLPKGHAPQMHLFALEGGVTNPSTGLHK